jgi:hypothetical protein
MILKLEKAYRHSYAREFGSDDKDWYVDAYKVLVKVKKDNPEWYPWEKVCPCTLRINYDGHPNRYGHHWSVSGFSEEMDKIMLEEFGDTYKSYATSKDMMKDLEKIVARNIPVHYKCVNDKFVPIKYELA